MSASHQTGNIVGTRQGSVATIHTIVVDSTGASGVPRKVLTIDGTSQRPGFFRCIGGAVMIVSNAGTTHTVSVGTNPATYDNLIAAGTNIRTPANGAGTAIQPVAAGLFLVVAPLDIFVLPTFTGAAPTAGATVIFIETWDVNPSPNTAAGD